MTGKTGGEKQKTGEDIEIDTNAPKSHQRAHQTYSKNKQSDAQSREVMEEKQGILWSGGRDSNPQQSAWKADALPIELPPQG